VTRDALCHPDEGQDPFRDPHCHPDEGQDPFQVSEVTEIVGRKDPHINLSTFPLIHKPFQPFPEFDSSFLNSAIQKS